IHAVPVDLDLCCVPSSLFLLRCVRFFLFNDPATSELFPLSLHDALPICIFSWLVILLQHLSGWQDLNLRPLASKASDLPSWPTRSEEHTSELQSRFDLVCRLLLEKKNRLKEATCGALV